MVAPRRPDVIIRFGGDSAGFNAELAKVQGTLAGFARQGNRLAGGLGGVGVGLAGLVGLSGIAGLAREAGTAADSLALLSIQMERLSGRGGGMGLVADMANELGVDLDDAAQSVVRLSPAFQKLGRSFNETVQFATNLQKTLRVYGTDAADAVEVTRQLAQGLSSGTLAGDELKVLRERAGQLGLDLERAVHQVTGLTGTLKELGSQGALTPQVIGDAFDIEAEYSFEPFSAGTRVTQVSNVKGKGFFKAMLFLFGGLMKGASCKALDKELQSLKDFCESRSTPQSS